jgi:hypothetical protein
VALIDMPSPVTGRRYLLALLVTLPTALGSAGVLAVEAWRRDRPEAPPVGWRAGSLAAAIQIADLQEVYARIQLGEAQTGRIPVLDPKLTGSVAVHVPPVLWAVATQSERSVAMLLGHGPPVDAATVERALCIAETLRNEAIIALLRPYRDAECTAVPLPSRDRPLLQ